MKAPNWAKNAIPTVRGWVDPKTGELLKAMKIDRSVVNIWHAKETPAPAPKPEPLPLVDKVEEVAVIPDEGEVSDPSALPKTKHMLEEYARRVHNIELDRRMTYANMVEDLESQLNQ
jgi:hypothetical protein